MSTAAVSPRRHWFTILAVLAVVTSLLTSAGGAQPSSGDIVVAPGASGAGTVADPASLAATLDSRTIAPGTTVWLRGGTYTGRVISRSDGTRQSPITIRPYPGEHAVIDGDAASGGATVRIEGDWQTWRDLEFTNSDPTRWRGTPGSDGRPTLIDVLGLGTTLINNSIHDGGNCIGWWKPAGESLVYGNLIYNCGWDASDRGHGHGVYVQNEDGARKRFEHNIVGSTYGRSFMVLGSDQVHDVDVIENVFAGGHSLGREVKSPVYIEGGVRDMRFHRNHLYTLTKEPLTLRGPGDEVTIEDNYMMTTGDALAAVWIRGGRPVSGSGNHIASHAAQIRREPGTSLLAWDENTYHGPDRFYPSTDLADWQGDTGQDGSSVVVASNPTHVAVMPNAYESDRGIIAVWNGAGAATVSVDVSSILEPGDSFSIYGAEDLGGAPHLTGTYQGGSLTVPMTGRSVGSPIGDDAPPAWGREFGAFLLLGGGSQPVEDPGDRPDPDGSDPTESPRTCQGQPATIIARPGVPTIGTDGRDVIVGTSGPDLIRGEGGDDLICGRGGADEIHGNEGDDTIHPGKGRDTVRAGKGDDRVLASSGADDVWGQSGRDDIRGGTGADNVRGGSGADVIRGGKGSDRLRGGTGFDTVAGNSGIDDCAGGPGRDLIVSCP